MIKVTAWCKAKMIEFFFPLFFPRLSKRASASPTSSMSSEISDGFEAWRVHRWTLDFLDLFPTFQMSLMTRKPAYEVLPRDWSLQRSGRCWEEPIQDCNHRGFCRSLWRVLGMRVRVVGPAEFLLVGLNAFDPSTLMKQQVEGEDVVTLKALLLKLGLSCMMTILEMLAEHASMSEAVELSSKWFWCEMQDTQTIRKCYSVWCMRLRKTWQE